MPKVTGTFIYNGLPYNGATAKLWPASAFASDPAKGDALPAGSPIATVTTGTAHGGDGAYRFTGVTTGEYYVSVQGAGSNVYFYAPLIDPDNIPETSIDDGGILGRLAQNETVTGAWTFAAALVAGSTLGVTGMLTASGRAAILGNADVAGGMTVGLTVSAPPYQKFYIRNATDQNLAVGGPIQGPAGSVSLSAINNAVSANVPLELRGSVYWFLGGLKFSGAHLISTDAGNLTISPAGIAVVTKELQASGGGHFLSRQATAGTAAYQASVDGDPYSRMLVTAGGTIYWGPGNGAFDALLTRVTNGFMQFQSRLVVSPSAIAGATWTDNSTYLLNVGGTYTQTNGDAVYPAALNVSPTFAINETNSLGAFFSIFNGPIYTIAATKTASNLYVAQWTPTVNGPGSASVLYNVIFGGTVGATATVGSWINNHIGPPSITAGGTLASYIGLSIAAVTDAAITTGIGIQLADQKTRGIWFSSDTAAVSSGIVWGAAVDVSLYRGGANLLRTDSSFGLGTAALGGGQKVLAIGNATIVPSANPAGGGVLYVEAGALKYRGSGGTVTTVANA